MNKNDLLDAIGGADDRFKQEVIDHMNKSTNHNRGKYQRPVRRTLRLIPAAAALICLLAVTAYAAVSYWGIFDFQKDAPRPLPTEAQELVETHTEQGSNDYITCSITESLTDGQKIYVTVQLAAKEPGKYFLLTGFSSPETPLADIGMEGEGTIGEYADANNLECIYADADLKRIGEGGSGVQSFYEKYHSPDVVDILIEADVADVSIDGEGICDVTAHDEAAAMSGENISRQEIPFTLTNETTGESTSGENVYRPTSHPDVEGLTIRSVTVTQTDLKTYFDIDMDMSEDLMYSGMRMLRIWHGETYDTAYGVLADDGQWQWRIESSKMEVGDSFILELWDPGDDSFTGEIEFTK